MRHLLLLAALTATSIAALSAADPLEGLRFIDGRDHRLSEWPGQPVVLVYFCGHCPTARKMMNTSVQELGNLIETEHLAAQLICVTPDLEGDNLLSYSESVCTKIAKTALFAHDPGNSRQIGLQNIFQKYRYLDGAESTLKGSDETIFRASKAFRYPVADLPESATAAWWMVERGRPGALSSAIKARAKDPNAKLIVAAVEDVLGKRQDTLLTAPESLDTIEGIEQLLVQGEGLPALKPSSERLKTLLKLPALKDELKARELFFACKQQLASSKTKEQEAAKVNLAKLAKLYPDTSYGKRASASR